MGKNTKRQETWTPLSKLRKAPLSFSGGFYSPEFVEKHGLKKEGCMECGDRDAVLLWIPEFLEIALREDGEIWCRLCPNGPGCRKEEEAFQTSKGTFLSYNNGEFGGKLLTPKRKAVRGNFVKVFEFGGRIYAVDSLTHFVTANTAIYMFSDTLEPVLLYGEEWPHPCSRDSVAFRGLHIRKDAAFLLVSGRHREHWYDASKDAEDVSYLFEIAGGWFLLKETLPYFFHSGNELLISNGHLYLGMDKVVADVDLQTKTIHAYTPLPEEAEAESRRLFEKYGWKYF